MAILVTGGAGFIGSHTVKHFTDLGEEVIVVDNLHTGHRGSLSNEIFYELDIRDTAALEHVFNQHPIEAVIHFAASSLVGESGQHPHEYYHNNVYGTMCLLDVMRRNDVNWIVFSSTAATYGDPERIPIKEQDVTSPTNTYGETKLTMEKMMKWYDHAYGLKYVSLRYFNAAGAHPSGAIGERHDPETHLIPLILEVPNNQREKVYIFGDRYPTKDGTCIRDYVHVMDLASAHHDALNYLRAGKESDIFNLGNGNGYSVKEVIAMAREVTGHPIPAEVKERRDGDPAQLIASSEKAKQMLGWEPRYGSLRKIIEDAWKWHSGEGAGKKVSTISERLYNVRLAISKSSFK
ncbi:UDP-glucose 4-epimerase GalE [Geomicrobium sp. JSM 1781026]|uniref:UDP-glucose 4-epimerase GalE n=1 Tax=Geomicrobium sp. JSM 1781026 TaxID=3344580 RepID=UPI0035BEDBBC